MNDLDDFTCNDMDWRRPDPEDPRPYGARGSRSCPDGTGVGERNGRAKLTERQVLAIRASSGPLSVQAERYGVGINAISKIRRCVSWTHLP